MEFTFSWYKRLVDVINATYDIKNWNDEYDGVIIRHDVDYDLKKAYEFAVFEKELGIKSTYLMLVSGDFYNVFSAFGQRYIDGILNCGHKIGLHFDEKKYIGCDEKNYIQDKIKWESEVLSSLIGEKVDVVSMHRPSERMLEWNLEIPGMINTYSRKFFSEYKYFSDSRKRWREDIIPVLKKKEYHNIQILIHPFWYDDEEMGIHESIVNFVNSANKRRYNLLSENFTNLDQIMKRDEIK